jgi:hypothetical protein
MVVRPTEAALGSPGNFGIGGSPLSVSTGSINSTLRTRPGVENLPEEINGLPGHSLDQLQITS